VGLFGGIPLHKLHPGRCGIKDIADKHRRTDRAAGINNLLDFAPPYTARVPDKDSFFLVSISILDMEAILAMASPRNPKEVIL